jgi:hypothetical protein
MTTLERFLGKKPADLASEKKASESLKLEPSTDLVVTIKNLKSIFPEEPEETLMLLALQHQNPKDLENAVQKLLEEGNSCKSFSKTWNTIKARDKNNWTKNDQRNVNKGFKENFRNSQQMSRRNEEGKRSEFWKDGKKNEKKYKVKAQDLGKGEKSREIDGKSREIDGKSREKDEKSREKDEKGGENREKREEMKEKREEIRDKREEMKEKREETREKKEETKEKNEHLSGLPRQVEEALNGPRARLPKLWSEISVSPPQEINENSHFPPETIQEHPIPCPERRAEKVVASAKEDPAKVAKSSESNLKAEKSSSLSAQLNPLPKVETRDFGVQVEMMPGIPIMIYPYMFKGPK